MMTHNDLPSEAIFTNGSEHFPALINDIKNAKQSIDLETFIFNHDNLGKRIVAALSRAARRGVKVRVIVDSAGSPRWAALMARHLEKAGVETKVFHPFPWQLWNWSRSAVKLPVILKMIYLLLKINSRNHRKVCLIDDKIAYIGSINISMCHLSISDGGLGWRDTSARFSQLQAADFIELQKGFDITWANRSIKERLHDAFEHIKQDPRVRLNYTRHRRRLLYKYLLRRMQLCQKRIWITNAYFVPDNFLLRRLKEAASNHVDVRILLPKKSDIWVMPWASSAFYDSLLKAGVKIYEYLPSMLHSKTLILDDWMSIGSSNLNHRSLLHDYEVDITLFSSTAKKQLEKNFLDDLNHSRELKFKQWKNSRPLYQRAFGRMLLYLKYWI